MPSPRRREREEALLKSLEDGTYQEFLDGDLVCELVRIIEASHQREDAIQALTKWSFPKEAKVGSFFGENAIWLEYAPVLAILDGQK